MQTKVNASPAARMRQTPDGQELCWISYGETVTVEALTSDNKWAYISYNGMTGYIMKKNLAPLENATNIPLDTISQNTASNTSESMPFTDRFSFSAASGRDRPYVVYQVTLKEKFIGTGSGNLTELEDVINHFFDKGYRLHSISTSNGGSKGSFMGDRIQATLVFEKIDLFK